MGILFKFTIRILINAAILLVAKTYFSGFVLGGDNTTLVIAAFLLTLLNFVVKPLLKIITIPFVWITFGLFNIVINITILFMLDALLQNLSIQNIWTYLLISTIIAIANSLF